MKIIATFLVVLSLSNAGFLDSIKENVMNEVNKTSTSESSDKNIIDTISSEYNLNTLQSSGALTSILSYAKSNMSTTDFSSILSSLDLNSVLSNTITSSSNSTSVSDVVSTFSSLGIDSSTIGLITKTVIEYYTNNSTNNTLVSTLKSSLTNLLSSN